MGKNLEERIKMLESLARMAKGASQSEIDNGNTLADHFDVLGQAMQYERETNIVLEHCEYVWKDLSLIKS